MIREKISDDPRINAREKDAFDIFNIQHYVGPNPYLSTAAIVFDFDLTGDLEPLAIEDYVTEISKFCPQLKDKQYESYGHLLAETIMEVGKLQMNLHPKEWSVTSCKNHQRIAVETIHARTTKAVIYFVWDWWEAITQNDDFPVHKKFKFLQEMFRASVYGGPTVYSLFRTATQKGIPVFYLWDEGLMQYGYGKKLVRGVATTFDRDSHLDSDFTTRKDDCKDFLYTLGFPVPKGDIVSTFRGALDAADIVGYPVAVKPVVGHKGIGVTANVQNGDELEHAFNRALKAIPETQPVNIIVERSYTGADFRLLCVNGKFVAATERRPAWVNGDGNSTISELITKENSKPERLDTPTSPMGKIQVDEAMEMFLDEQNLTMDSVIEADKTIYLRKVANLSAGGVSIDATATVHPDNIILAQDIAQHFRMVCMGIDVITETLAESWKSGNFAILEINAAPGIFMHLNPAFGESVDVPSFIIETFFKNANEARIPIITFNRISMKELEETIDHILLKYPGWTVGAVCRQGVFVNRSKKVMHKNYNTNVQSLLRNPKLDLLIAEYCEDILESDGMFYQGSNIIVLDNPTATEKTLVQNAYEDATIVEKQGDDISIRREGWIENYQLRSGEPFTPVYLKQIGTIL
ncbi:cyanophycin synthetase [Phormidium sp. LEGE 05292]|uniref:ATP-binding protein n=1 Tax=[Phormidium] sp. LEGE 05292 TaxID=767427 RepID=UPI00187F2535|nr:cyanophycin synthetase [Phormidium sp. LEGE 05292]MBE9224705.1 cyanophycin synthetase [Phormidium sp. LEGE 05292]